MNQTILLVMPSQRRRKLENFLSDNGLDVLTAGDAKEALKMLAGRHHYDLVFAESELADGSWRDLVPAVLYARNPCEMVVCTRCGAERLWAEVLQCGVYDLIPEPYEHPETLRIIRSALEGQYMRRFMRPVEAMAS